MQERKGRYRRDGEPCGLPALKDCMETGSAGWKGGKSAVLTLVSKIKGLTLATGETSSLQRVFTCE